jgi:predicted Zn-dependent protease
MKKHYWIDAAKLILVFGAMWAGFSLIPWHKLHAPKSADLVTTEQEKKLGDVLFEQSVLADSSKHPIVHSRLLDSAIDIISERLLSKIDSPLFAYHFYVVDKKEVNAFTLPGGNIVIYTGLLSFCNSPEDLAAVLAHELGHAQKRHVVTKLVNELGITLTFSILSGGNASVIREIVRTAVSGTFSRDMEREADSFSFSLMERSRLDPSTLSSFFRRMKKESEYDAQFLEFASTHPSNSERIRAALSYKTAPGFSALPFNLDWKRIRNALKAKKEEREEDIQNERKDTIE